VLPGQLAARAASVTSAFAAAIAARQAVVPDAQASATPAPHRLDVVA